MLTEDWLRRQMDDEVAGTHVDGHQLLQGVAGKVRRRRNVRYAAGGTAALIALVCAVATGVPGLVRDWADPAVTVAPSPTDATAAGPPTSEMMTAPEPTDFSDLAEQRGALVLGSADGCPGIESNGLFQPVIWPFGWTVISDPSGEATLLDETGEPVGSIGDPLILGGGLVGDDSDWNQHPCATSLPFLAGSVERGS